MHMALEARQNSSSSWKEPAKRTPKHPKTPKPKSEYSNTPNPPKKTADPKPIPAETLRRKSGAELFGPSAFLIRKRQDSSPTYTGAESPRPSFMKSMAET